MHNHCEEGEICWVSQSIGKISINVFNIKWCTHRFWKPYIHVQSSLNFPSTVGLAITPKNVKIILI